MVEDLRDVPYFLDRCRISTASEQEVDNNNPMTNCRGRKYKLLPCISDIVPRKVLIVETSFMYYTYSQWYPPADCNLPLQQLLKFP